ncbi:hypothetical protein HK407_02g04830 [Ordospora pajunii]|uniref:uncharacterized protein n=1 Tax=Ordospora pajunii TaxID=3039483 RepID=UPI0029526B00|nr:uncharacterized protein HK407_02g04830 [Ordospora pajunii]KAH9412034.1 hypothetical protein HK407_02g04830 [Ordospora pajunii]
MKCTSTIARALIACFCISRVYAGMMYSDDGAKLRKEAEEKREQQRLLESEGGALVNPIETLNKGQFVGSNVAEQQFDNGSVEISE